ncbi:MAG: lipoyl(octanoyl) transferase LipB [Nocardioidaceae bacterium]
MSELSVVRVGFGPAAVDYMEGWALQRRIHSRRVEDEIDDTVLFLEHRSVYTAGKRTEPQDRPLQGIQIPVIEVDRGGKITWHGPGQLVGYPIAKLPSHVYVVDYVRRIEEALIRVCTDLGLSTGRVKGRSGVWLSPDAGRPERKVAALGIRVSKGVTMHGFALNCNNTMEGFDAIVPCGIADAGVTTLTAELGRDVTVEETLPLVEGHLRDLLAWAPYERAPDLRLTEAVGAARSPITSTGATITYGLQPLGG